MAEPSPVPIPTTTRTVPDPSTLTTDQLLRVTEQTVQLLKTEIEGERKLMTASFASIAREFAVIEMHRIEQKTDTKTAVDDALKGAEKAVEKALTAADKAYADLSVSVDKAIAKLEASLTKQIDQQNAIFAGAIATVVAGFDALKERVGKMENIKIGSNETRDIQRLDLGVILSVLSLVAVVIFAMLK